MEVWHDINWKKQYQLKQSRYNCVKLLHHDLLKSDWNGKNLHLNNRGLT